MTKINRALHVTRDGQVKKNPRKPLRRFYYKITGERREGSGRRQKVAVMQMKRSGLVPVGETSWNTASTKGEQSEVMQFLKSKKLIPRNAFPRGYYSWSEGQERNIHIEAV